MKKLLIAGIILFITGCIGMVFTNDNIDGKGEYNSDKKLKYQYNKINIDGGDGSISIRKSNDNHTHIITKNAENENSYKVNNDNHTLYVKGNVKGRNVFNYGPETRDSSKLIIQLPEKQYKSIKIDSREGAIDLESLHADNIIFKVRAGEVSIKRLTSEYTKFDIGAGELTVADIDCRDIDMSVGTVVADIKGIEKNTDINGRIGTGEALLSYNEKPDNAAFDLYTKIGDIKMNGIVKKNEVIGEGKAQVKFIVDIGTLEFDVDKVR